ncbi:MAG: glutamate racemase [Alphaproteobacteria bacterium]|nr:glutamate racemase [Alphaproteobacteria bacterium]
MKLGLFDSGLGGLIVTRAIHAHMPDLDLVYLGDTLRVPYGNRSQEAITGFTKRAMKFLFAQDCQLIVIACNTASAAALRNLQQEFLPAFYPDRNILGVIIPTVEEAAERDFGALGLIGTSYTLQSGVYDDELQKIAPRTCLIKQATPLLVPLIENGGMPWVEDVLRSYLSPLREEGMEGLLLGCTHYPHIKAPIRRVLGEDFPLLSQDEIMPAKLADYLRRHPEHDTALSRTGTSRFYVTDLTESYATAAREIFGEAIHLEKAEI